MNINIALPKENNTLKIFPLKLSILNIITGITNSTTEYNVYVVMKKDSIIKK